MINWSTHMISMAEGASQYESVEWRLYRNMLVTRLFEEALIRWEHEGKHLGADFSEQRTRSDRDRLLRRAGEWRYGDSFFSHSWRHDRHGRQYR